MIFTKFHGDVSFEISTEQLWVSKIPRSNCEFYNFHEEVASFVKFQGAVSSFINSVHQESCFTWGSKWIIYRIFTSLIWIGNPPADDMAAIIWLCLRECVRACVRVCVFCKHAGYFQSRNFVLTSTPKSSCRNPVYKFPLKYSVGLINTTPHDLDVMCSLVKKPRQMKPAVTFTVLRIASPKVHRFCSSYTRTDRRNAPRWYEHA